MAVPLFDPGSALALLREELRAAVEGVLDSGVYVLGPELRAFEQEFAAYVGVKHVIGVGNGTDALTLALLALGVGPGDDVVVPSFTFYASAESIPPTGARPVFCEVDPDTFCITAETVREALTPATKAIVAVDLFGNPAPIDELREFGLPIVEDAAQAAGSTLRGRPAGSLGTVATFSFYPSKNIAAFGDGGAVATDDDDLADELRLLRSHGSRDKSTFVKIGFNSRLDEIQAAVLRVCLRQLDTWADGRRSAAELYHSLGLDEFVTLPVAVEESSPAWHLYVIRHGAADELAASLTAAGIGNKAYYRTPVHRQPSMSEYASGVSLPVTDELSATNLAIPMAPTLEAAQIQEVLAAVASACGARARSNSLM
jgi:dTDP-4-amino-4,6-dideoxygalactose transaminase